MTVFSLSRAAWSLAIASALLPALALADGPNGEQCGPNDGGAKCGMNVCCSAAGYCGTTSAYCGSGCQSLYGSCTVPQAPTCDKNGKSATNGRRVGYWQVQQAHDRSCDVVLPSQISTAGVSHLVLAFAHIDPSSFAVVAADSADVSYYTQFTSLKSSSLKTWIAIGGGGFSVATWSAMAATATSRAQFINSLLSFMKQYGFQGVDLDWEFPNESGSDAQNLVALVRELRAAFGTTYGISAALPADWGSVRGFDGLDMAQYMDFFNYMAYDIHGWGIDFGTRQSNMSYPADIREIDTDMLPLWSSKIPPAKVNIGIPLYGRGYTLANTGCSTVGCTASGPSNSASCVRDTSGVMILTDIKQTLSANNAAVTLDRSAIQKYATWGNGQWMAYDDADTLLLKLAWADGRCLGGAMFWSADFNSGSLTG
ncbi:glycoside hydrolase, partial [Thozetella sp. PMI_491]